MDINENQLVLSKVRRFSGVRVLWCSRRRLWLLVVVLIMGHDSLDEVEESLLVAHQRLLLLPQLGPGWVLLQLADQLLNEVDLMFNRLDLLLVVAVAVVFGHLFGVLNQSLGVGNQLVSWLVQVLVVQCVLDYCKFFSHSIFDVQQILKKLS